MLENDLPSNLKPVGDIVPVAWGDTADGGGQGNAKGGERNVLVRSGARSGVTRSTFHVTGYAWCIAARVHRTRHALPDPRHAVYARVQTGNAAFACCPSPCDPLPPFPLYSPVVSTVSLDHEFLSTTTKPTISIYL